jgi:hypothetical protein
MGDLNDFVSHPRTFLRNNILIVKGPEGGTGGSKIFKFGPSSSMAGKDMLVNGTPAMRVFVLSLGMAIPGDDVQAYWCPYADSSALGTTLPGVGGPNMMFTFAMDGCTFVAGSKTPSNDITVHHVNMKLKHAYSLDPSVASQQQRKIQKHVAKGLVGDDAMLIDPDDYYDPTTRQVVIPTNAKISTVTFGRRSSSGAWKFYTHQWYTVPGDRFTLCYIGCERYI